MDIHEMRLAVLALADGDVDYAKKLMHFVVTGEERVPTAAEIAELPLPGRLYAGGVSKPLNPCAVVNTTGWKGNMS